jgi:hypothetical protein
MPIQDDDPIRLLSPTGPIATFTARAHTQEEALAVHHDLRALFRAIALELGMEVGTFGVVTHVSPFCGDRLEHITALEDQKGMPYAFIPTDTKGDKTVLLQGVMAVPLTSGFATLCDVVRAGIETYGSPEAKRCLSPR